MPIVSEYNKGIRFLLCLIDIYSKYAWDFLLKDNKVITIANAFKKICISLIANQTQVGK